MCVVARTNGIDNERLKLHFSRVPLESMPAHHFRSADVPVFDLYGENGLHLMPDLVHVESIATRSSLHNWEIKPHRHHGLFQLLWLECGSAQLLLDGASGEIEGGTVVLVPQHCVHGFRFSCGAGGLVATIAHPLLSRLGIGPEFWSGSAAGARLCQLSQLPARAPVEALLWALEPEYLGQSAHRGQLLQSMIGALLVWLLREPDTAPDAPEAPDTQRARLHLAAFSAEVERRFAQHLPLAFYAGKLGISSAHLNAVCRQLAQRSALEIIHARLVLEACRKLAYTSMSIKAIAELLGFSDPAYFTRFFRARAGLAPRDFRYRALSAATSADAA